MTNLTKDADKMICILYKEFLSRRKSGLSKSSACEFGSSETVHSTLFNKQSLDDIDETLRELSRADYVSCFFADNTIYNFSITSDCIIYMENRFKTGLIEVTDFIAKLIP
ncbi:hypothetical protein [[Clostridium] fimetarium]|uniref:YjcQ protein n=1 Tax=[Clostridium] fimetarium TaxID=99656 RepID=A0A1I0M072_9FIRM|nr:hypothetical protein [[Clostridium] fimetarium]SEV81653.1 hypothetical protein SAMN05421659_10131 [[Clostridium] fimetarium]